MSIIKDIRYLLLSSVFSKGIDIVRGVIMAKFLTPELYGILNVVNQVRALAKYGDIGFTGVVERDYNFYSTNDPERAAKVRDVGYTFEILTSLLLGLVLFLSIFFLPYKQIILVGIGAASLGLISRKMLRILNTEFRIQKNFKGYSKYFALDSLFVSVLVIATVPFFGIHSPYFLPTIGNILTAVFILRKHPLKFNFDIDWKKVKEIAATGIKLSGLTFLTGMGIYTERYLLVSLGGFEIMGLFAFSLFIIESLQRLTMDFVRPYIPRMHEEMGKGNYLMIMDYCIKPTLKILPLIIVGSVALYFTLPLVVNYFFNEYSGGLRYFEILLPIVYVGAAGSFSGYLLYSPGVKKMGLAYVCGFTYPIILAGLGYLLYHNTDLGIEGIALAMVVALAIKTTIQFTAIFSLRIKPLLIILFIALVYIPPIVYYKLLVF